MRTWFALPAALAVALLTAAPASAHGTHTRPAITRLEWLTGPVAVGEEEILVVEAHDPDSSISEVDVVWGDEGISFAHTYCVQGTEIGKPARLVLSWKFPHPGLEDVRVVALSQDHCKPNRSIQRSPTKHLPTPVRP